MGQKVNKIKCLKCGVILESTFRWDFQSCECGSFVDGGLDYCRVGGNFADILIWDWETDEWNKLTEMKEGDDK